MSKTDTRNVFTVLDFLFRGEAKIALFRRPGDMLWKYILLTIRPIKSCSCQQNLTASHKIEPRDRIKMFTVEEG